MKKKVITLLSAVLIYNAASAQIVLSDPHAANKSSHFITSGDLKLGISNKAGGAINSVIIPKTPDIDDSNRIDIMRNQAERYGRLCQMNIRDTAHTGVYNPTQAGFNETLGTQCVINSSINPSKLTVNRHRMTLFRGDGKYDYIKNENIGSDGYGSDASEGDDDNVAEQPTQGQNDEVSSEFSFECYYEDFKPKLPALASQPAIGVVLFHSEIDFNFAPGFCLSQFTAQGVLKSGAPVYNPSKANPNISNTIPNNVNAGGVNDLSYIPARLTFTWDIKEPNGTIVFDPRYRYFRNGTTWSGAEDRYVNDSKRQDVSGSNRSAIMVSESNSDGVPGRSICIYKPASKNNITPVVGKSTSTNNIIYRDDRVDGRDLGDTRNRVPNYMSVMFFTSDLRGLFNRNKLTNLAEVNNLDAYEGILQDYFLIYGRTPGQVKDAVQSLDNYFANNPNLVLSKNSDNILEILPDSKDSDALSIFPNPATNVVNIKLSNDKKSDITIYNEAGKLILSKQNISGNISIPTAQIGGPGIYFVKTDIETKKLIIGQ